jgi:mRNA interferase RelE/StbE
MESYKIIFAPRFIKDIKSLPRNVAQVVWEQAKSLQQNQRPANCKKLKGANQNEYRLRVHGNYRILYKIFDKEKTVYVLRALDRKDAYR